MSSEVYELIIRPREGAPREGAPGEGAPGEAPTGAPTVALERSELERRLACIPGVQADGPGSFSFGEPDANGSMRLEFGETIDIRIPRPWVMERGPQVFALVFMLAEWSAGEVYDPQIDDTLEKDHVLQGMVAMRQAQREKGSGSMPEQSARGREEEPARPRRPWFKRGR
ncbi:hypothetical protein DRQ53_00605 [bacterium]|nr:MAG: hypothetical protein DRQ32_05710 [bacterium]RKZ18389.1 MAG: hypothetical protein DRQ53_00605 [bacterium]